MPTIWDLMPASFWPTQPLIPMSDPTQQPAWPQAAPPIWNPSALHQPSFGWPTTPSRVADAPPDLAVSGSPWDSAVRQALAAQAGPSRDSDMRDMAYYDQALADAKRAHDFVKWVLGPPSMPQAAPTNDAVLRGVSLKDIGDGARNAVPSGNDARAIEADNSVTPIAAPQMPTAGANNASNAALPSSEPAADPWSGLGAATGNPNIQRQGERQRTVAGARPPLPPAIADIGLGIGEAPFQIVGGVRDAGQSLLDLQNWLADHRISINPAMPGFVVPRGLDPLITEFLAPHALFDLPEVRQPASVTGGAVRAVSQFLAGFAAGGPVAEATALPRIGQMMLRGAGADFFFRGGHDKRLSDLIEEVPELRNPVTAYLKSDPNDSEAEGRFKNAIEGLGLGALTEGLFLGVRGIRNASRLRTVTNDARAIEEAPRGEREPRSSPSTDDLPYVEGAPPTAPRDVFVDPKEITDLRPKYGLPNDDHTVAIARTTVPGLENWSIEGASTGVRKTAKMSPLKMAPFMDKPYEPTSSNFRARGHAEQDIVNQFKRAIDDLRLRPSDLDGHVLVIRISHPGGACRHCMDEDGVLKKLSRDYPGLTIQLETPAPSKNFTVKNGRFDFESDQ